MWKAARARTGTVICRGGPDMPGVWLMSRGSSGPTVAGSGGGVAASLCGSITVQEPVVSLLVWSAGARTAVALTWRSLQSMAEAASTGGRGTRTAPSRHTATALMVRSMPRGSRVATRSPGVTPWEARTADRCAARRERSPKVRVVDDRSGWTSVTAVRVGSCRSHSRWATLMVGAV